VVKLRNWKTGRTPKEKQEKAWLCIPLLGLGRFFYFLDILQSLGQLGRGISSSQGRYLHTQNKRTQASMPPVEFDPTIPVFERAKTVHALESAATVIGYYGIRTCVWKTAVMVILTIFGIVCDCDM
jgi:hypothetical protein